MDNDVRKRFIRSDALFEALKRKVYATARAEGIVSVNCPVCRGCPCDPGAEDDCLRCRTCVDCGGMLPSKMTREFERGLRAAFEMSHTLMGMLVEGYGLEIKQCACGCGEPMATAHGKEE